MTKKNTNFNFEKKPVQYSSDCFLTSACMEHMQDKFDDNCDELTTLRWFRDNFVSEEDKAYYYQIAPLIIEGINTRSSKSTIYTYIYYNVVAFCVEKIKNGEYDAAYKRYKNSISCFEEQFARESLEQRLVNALTKAKH